MALTYRRHIAATLVVLAGLGGPAVAQSPSCNAWRGELASLQNQRPGGDPGAARAAQRVGAELSQLINRSRAIGCDRQQFLFFGDAPPAECGPLRGRIGQLQSQFGGLQRQAQGGGDGSEQRRIQLATAIRSYCQQGVYQSPEPARERNFFEALFGIDQQRRPAIDSTLPELDPERPPAEDRDRPRLGGSRAVCVRTCDGFFFPLANNPGGRDGPEEMCQALCPGASTAVYLMAPDGDIQNAASRGGEPYASLPNAAKYTRSFDSTCTCKAAGQSWSQALRDAEDLLGKRKGDVILTEARAAELSRPRPEQKPEPKRPRGAPPPPPVQPVAAELDEPPPIASPTAGTESAGVGPQTIDGNRTLQQGEGQRQDVQTESGQRKTIRIVGPTLGPNFGQGLLR